MLTTYIALLRGINVGGKNKVPMKELAALFGALDYSEPKTYLQSGNVVFQAEGTEAQVTQALEARVAKHFGLNLAVVVRTPAELAALKHPYRDDPARLHVAFLAEVPTAPAIASLEPDRFAPDQFQVQGRDIYLHYPNGAGRSKMTLDYFEKRLKTRGTARNWNTVEALLKLSAGA